MDMKQPAEIKAPPGQVISHGHGERSIGAILIDEGRLTPADVEKILREQKLKGIRFGDAAVSLGLLREHDIDFALSRQFEYPYLQPTDDSIGGGVVAAFRPTDPVVEELRGLRSQLMVRWFDEPQRRMIVVASPERGEGRSFIAANLAVVFSQLGEKTLLIDADLRHPVQHKLFRLEGRPGLSNLLAGRAGEDVIVRIPSLLGLSVLPAGTIPPNPQELLTRPQFPSLLSRLGTAYDVVIIDSPSLATADDVSVIASRAGAALLVSRCDFSSMKSMHGLGARLTRANSTVVGSVLNQF
jgi:chain length determinant protein tyrosine kinase EpsG